MDYVCVVIILISFFNLGQLLPTTGVCPNPPPFDTNYCMRVKIAPGCQNDSDCTSQGMKCCPSGPCHVNGCVTPLRKHRPGCPVDKKVCKQYQQLCNSDKDCQKGEQCCYNPSCGTSCQRTSSYTDRPTRGVCPKRPPFDAEFCSLADFMPGCDSDVDCASQGKKCCASGKCHVLDCVTPIRRRIRD